MYVLPGGGHLRQVRRDLARRGQGVREPRHLRARSPQAPPGGPIRYSDFEFRILIWRQFLDSKIQIFSKNVMFTVVRGRAHVQGVRLAVRRAGGDRAGGGEDFKI